MTRSIGARVAAVVALAVPAVVAASALLATAPFTAPAGAAGTNPCKVLKRSEIQQAFGGTVAVGRKGVGTAVSAQCEYQVSAAGDRPAGTVTVHLTTTGAQAAYKGLKKSKRYAAIDGVPNALYGDTVHVVDVLQGDVLLGVQGGFLITDPLPLHFYDDRTQLTDLARIGAGRV
jgi:hypothetical protein